MIHVGIVGAAGYTGGELLRLLQYHPSATVAFAMSTSQAGQPVYATHTDLVGTTNLVFTDAISDVDVLFLCSGHGHSKKFLEQNIINPQTKIIDLSTDFRDQSDGFVYGLAEWQKDQISKASKVANPGCFATCIELGLLPLADQSLLSHDIHVSAITGSTGAGQALSASTHFSWRDGNMSTYKVFEHQHLKEISMVVNARSDIHFVPYRGNFTRGIIATTYTKTSLTLSEVHVLYRNFYESHPFTHVSHTEIDLKQVVNTNKALIHLTKKGDNLVITSIIDNLLKGASGQAVQNMNLMFGFAENSGLGLKASYF